MFTKSFYYMKLNIYYYYESNVAAKSPRVKEGKTNFELGYFHYNILFYQIYIICYYYYCYYYSSDLFSLYRYKTSNYIQNVFRKFPNVWWWINIYTLSPTDHDATLTIPSSSILIFPTLRFCFPFRESENLPLINSLFIPLNFLRAVTVSIEGLRPLFLDCSLHSSWRQIWGGLSRFLVPNYALWMNWGFICFVDFMSLPNLECSRLCWLLFFRRFDHGESEESELG